MAVRITECHGMAGRNLPPPLIAIFHPERRMAEQIAAAIGMGGYRCAPLSNPAQGVRGWLECDFALLLLNPFLGWEEPGHFLTLARTIAASRPMLVLTEADDLRQRIIALTSGGDDVVRWQDDCSEILARIGSLLRRSQMATGQYAFDDLRIDLIDRRVERAGRRIRLPPREFDLLANLARTPDRAVSRSALLHAVWRIDFDPGTNRVEVHMSRLRTRIDQGFAWPMLKTVKGRGYLLQSHPDLALWA